MSSEPRRPPREAWERFRRWTSPLWIRLLAFNLLLVFLPVVGISLLDVYESQLLAGQEREMVQQGRLLAAALGDLDGELEQASQGVLERLGQRNTARLRVIDEAGRVIADSSLSGPRETDLEDIYDEAEAGLRERPLYRLGSWLFRTFERLTAARVIPSRDREDDALPGGRATRAALEGRYGAATRLSPGQRSVTLYSAIPVRSGGRIVGAVLVSQSTLRILQDLYEVRLAIFEVVLLSVVVAAVLSLLLSGTIARPLHRLRREATMIVDRRGRLRGSFRGSTRRDEIGDLSRALESLSRSLEGHLRFIESFAADVSHEFRNPLAAIRSAVELLEDTADAGEKKQLIGIAFREIARLEGLLASVAEITSIDARLDEEEVGRVAPSLVLRGLLEERAARRVGASFDLAIEPEAEDAEVRMSPDRLVQAVRNLLDNAVSFSPDGGTIRVTLARESDEICLRVEDEGPGIPEEHLGRLFDRFFSYRADGPKGEHAGLGLAIVKAIVDGYGGRIEARNGDLQGAVFELRIPAAEG